MVPADGFIHVDIDPDVPGVAYPEASTLARAGRHPSVRHGTAEQASGRAQSCKLRGRDLPNPARASIEPSAGCERFGRKF